MKQILTLYSSTFLWINKKEGLLYNTEHYTWFRFALNPAISIITEALLNPDNLYSVAIDVALGKDDIGPFLKAIIDNKLGVLEKDDGQKRVISFPPLLSITRDWERIKVGEYRKHNEILSYYRSVTIYVGGKCPITDYYKQVNYPICSEVFLAADKILAFLATSNSSQIAHIDIVFSSVAEYPNLSTLLVGLKPYARAVTLFIRAAEIVDYATMHRLTTSGYPITIVHDPKESQGWEESSSAAYFVFSEARQLYLVSSEEDKHQIHNTIPLFDGQNYEFFLEKVFISEQEILGAHLSRRHIFAHMALNTLFFGSFFVMPSGEIYAHRSCSTPIGCIGDSIYNLIESELDNNTAWRKTRDAFPKCRECLYRYLCPSPTVYENVMGIDCVCSDFIKLSTKLK